MKPPVFFLAFANDADDHLPLLEEERKGISNFLLPLANEQYIQLFAEPAANIQDLSNYTAEFKDRIAIFHYGGHAESNAIMLKDQEANSDGLAHLLALQSNLKLVFLNGCSTRAQVDLLLSLGIPAVIATHVPIEDQSAKAFAQVFYKSLSTQHSIEDAFKLASANFLMEKGQAAGIYRGLKLRTEGDDELPWGLFVNDGKEKVLDWKIPLKSAVSFIVRGAGKRYKSGTSKNRRLIETIANAIADYSVEIRIMVEEAKAKGRSPKMRDLRAAVIDSFPTPIGTHLRKLLLSEDVSTERLKLIVNVYTVATELFSFVMLAQLWDEKFKKPELVIPEAQMEFLTTYFKRKEGDIQTFNYVDIIRNVSDIFDANNIEPFLEEFGELRKEFFTDSKFRRAYRFLEEIKEELASVITADEIESFCVQAEEHLCEIFTHLGFCVKYTLATIKTIELWKTRHETPRYHHNLVVLDRITAAFGTLDEVLISPDFSDNNSVVMLRDEEIVTPFLNLSPFVLDENALTGQQNSKLFFYRLSEHNLFQFTFVDNLTDTLEVTQEQYPMILEQFESFFRNVL